MCLAVPGQVIALTEGSDPPMGTVDVGGARTEACFAYLPEAAPGDWVIVHVGFAISRLDEAEARRSLAAFAEIDALEAGPNPPEPPSS
jgi:hydrogenase expression/formation protein HypC